MVEHYAKTAEVYALARFSKQADREKIEALGARVLAAVIDGADAKGLREAMDKLKDKLKSAAIVLAVSMAKGLPDPLNDALADPAARQAMEALITQLHSTAKLVERSLPLLS